MKAMILAAGKGTRVQPITHVIPKPMIPILQKPVMEFLLELLKEHGFKEIMVNVSHLAEEIENYFRDGQCFGVEIAYSFEGRIEDGELIGDALGSAGGLKKIQDFQNFLLIHLVMICSVILLKFLKNLNLFIYKKATFTEGGREIMNNQLRKVNFL